ncbi:hypothetical protein HI914_03656 [Erysiphe necator]|nr:hypothetical protein HI914_03656 [Erysiphe necator]
MSASQAEIWDDSALIESWNAALEEYKKYHSIKDNLEITEDKGDIEEKLPSVSEEIASTRFGDVANQDSCDAQPILEAEIIDDPQKESMTPQTHTESNKIASSTPLVPQLLIGQVQDEGIKNLLMSWYYAGYYTGLYEGQQRT